MKKGFKHGSLEKTKCRTQTRMRVHWARYYLKILETRVQVPVLSQAACMTRDKSVSFSVSLYKVGMIIITILNKYIFGRWGGTQGNYTQILRVNLEVVWLSLTSYTT